MALLDKVSSILSVSPGAIVVEQFRVLALRLYPWLIQDFAHKEDLRTALVSVYAELEQLKTLMRTHIHPVSPPTVPGAPQVASPTVIPVPVTSPTVIPGEEFALALLLPSGAVQPVSGGISVQPSRIDPLPIVTPPLNPIDALETLL